MEKHLAAFQSWCAAQGVSTLPALKAAGAEAPAAALGLKPLERKRLETALATLSDKDLPAATAAKLGKHEEVPYASWTPGDDGWMYMLTQCYIYVECLGISLPVGQVLVGHPAKPLAAQPSLIISFDAYPHATTG